MEKLPGGEKNDAKNMMAIGRTIMANERTLLAFLRTALGFFLGGTAMIKYLKHPFIEGLGWVFLVVAPVLLVWGVYRYKHVKKAIKSVTPANQAALEKDMGL